MDETADRTEAVALARRYLVSGPGDLALTRGETNRICWALILASDEERRLRERLGPRGLEVVTINGNAHYVNEAVKAEIERMRGVLRQIYEQYDNQDMSHEEFRVHAAQLAAPRVAPSLGDAVRKARGGDAPLLR